MIKKMIQKIKEVFSGNTPARLIFRYYLVIILVGAGILMLPFSLKEGNTLGLLEAIFTATSATSVTGLIVVDTASHFTFFGHLTIIILIMFGGFGVMVLKTALWLLLRRKIGFKDRELIMTEQNQVGMSGMVRLVKNILFIVFAIEGIGAVLLALRFYFYYDFPVLKSIWFGIFHAISAVNNAGFDITGASLVPFVHDYFIQTIFIVLIIFGGIGFPVILDLNEYFRQKIAGNEDKFKFSLFTKFTTTTYFIILVLGFVMIFGMEYNHFLANPEYNLLDKIYIALFQSVTTRNAGFATVDLGQFKDQTITLMSLMMFIGASPSSTGGGVRTTTFAIIFLFVYRMALGYSNIQIFDRRLPRETIVKALVTVSMGFFINFTAVMVMMISEGLSLTPLVFEVASAFGTTGLSMGITASLSAIGRIAIIMVMFIGQIGITTILLIFASEKKPVEYILYPEENVLIG